MRAKFVNEKFTDESDPIKDLGIGKRRLIEMWLQTWNIKNYTINKDLTIDVNDTVIMEYQQIEKLPYYIQFGIIKGNFFCNYRGLITFKGMPHTIKGIFGCAGNKIKTLKYMPKKIEKSLFIDGNLIKFTENEIRSLCNVKGNVFV
jgi:hypothetical protein